MNRRIAMLVALLVVVVLAVGCGENDAPVTTRDTTGAQKFNMPDHFDTVAAKCDGHGHRVFVTENSDSGNSAIAVISDETCSRVGP